MSNGLTLSPTKYSNNSRVVSGTYNVTPDDSILLCDTSLAAVTIELALIPAGKWSTQYKLYIKDNSGNAAVNNITINAPAGYLINGLASYVISLNSQAINVFIAADVNYGIANAVNAPVTNQVSDAVFSSAWNGITDIAPSKNAIYDKIITIGSGFGNTAFVRKGGDDNTAVVGNFLQPFGTIEAAIYGFTSGGGVNSGNGLMGPLTDPTLPFNQSTNPYTGTGVGFNLGSALNIDAGVYDIGDLASIYEHCPQGLKPQGSKFDVVSAVGAIVNNHCTYGLYRITAGNASGNVFGFGEYNNFANITDGIVVNLEVQADSGIVTFEFNVLKNNIAGTLVAPTTLLKILNCSNTTAYLINNQQRCFAFGSGSGSSTSATIDISTNARATLFGDGTYDSFGDNSPAENFALRITNPIAVIFKNTTITSRGDAFGNNNKRCIEITNPTDGVITFDNCYIHPVSSGSIATYKVVSFLVASPTILNNTTFRNCIMKSRSDSSFGVNGFSLFTPFNLDVKLINTYAESVTGGAGTIANILTVLDGTNNGFIVEPNL